MYRSITSVAILAVLSACGGGSSSDEQANNNPPSNENTYSVQVVDVDQCGTESINTTAQLIIHNDDFSNAETITTDSSGILKFSTEDDLRTVSIIT